MSACYFVFLLSPFFFFFFSFLCGSGFVIYLLDGLLILLGIFSHTVDEKISVVAHVRVVQWFSMFIRNMDGAGL